MFIIAGKLIGLSHRLSLPTMQRNKIYGLIFCPPIITRFKSLLFIAENCRTIKNFEFPQKPRLNLFYSKNLPIFAEVLRMWRNW